jgi:hypothetical protein
MSKARNLASLLNNSGQITAEDIGEGAAVPSQSGQSGKYLTTDGTNASWATITDPTPTVVSDQNNTSTGYFDLPAGTTAQRPSSPNAGFVRFNTTLDQLEQYTGDGWKGISAPPAVANTDVTVINDGEIQTVVISGLNFDIGATAKLVGATGVSYVPTTSTRNSSNQITIVYSGGDIIPNSAEEPLTVKVTNGSGLTSSLEDQINVNVAPVWSTSSGSLGTVTEGAQMSNINLTATDVDGDTVTFSLASASSLPSGVSLDSSGVLSGTPSVGDSYNAAGVVHNFIIEASDGTKAVPRTFSILRKWKDGSTSDLAVQNTSELVSLGLSNDFYYVDDGRQIRRYYVDCAGSESGEAGFMRVDSTWATYYNGGACINGGGTISANGIILANTNNGGGGSGSHGGCGVTTNVPFRATAIRLTDISYTSNGNWGGVNFPNPHFFIVNADTGTLSGNYYGGTYPGWGIEFSGTSLINQQRPSAGKQNLGGDYFVHSHLGVGSYSAGTNRPCQHRLWFKF